VTVRRELKRITCVVSAGISCEGAGVRTVVVQVDDLELASQMAAMREWLDDHHCTPTRFVYDQTADALVVAVEFPEDGEAEAFATRFNGLERLKTTHSTTILSSALTDPPVSQPEQPA
jgi:hypothetical protein